MREMTTKRDGVGNLQASRKILQPPPAARLRAAGAAALATVLAARMPERHIPVALMFFNLGVEAGQLFFVAVVMAVATAARQIRPHPEGACQSPAPKPRQRRGR